VKQSSSRPVFLINASIEALEAGDFDDLRRFDRIFVRDRASQAYLGENGIAAQWVPDLCLDSEPRGEPGRAGLVYTDSSVKSLSPLLERYSAALQARYAPMRPGRLMSYWCYAMADRAAFQASVQRYHQTIAGAQGVFAGRFHAMLFCLIAATPFLAVSSNTSKIEAVLDDVFGSRERVIPAATIAGMSPVEIPAFTPHEEERRLNYLSEARTGIKRMFDDIAAAT
jgi:polysaccharide pyruvyl transferase WcaK-like protein